MHFCTTLENFSGFCPFVVGHDDGTNRTNTTTIFGIFLEMKPIEVEANSSKFTSIEKVTKLDKKGLFLWTEAESKHVLRLN